MEASSATSIHPSNAEQLRAWDGDEGDYWAANADRFDRGVRHHHEHLMAAAGVRDGERVLDVGCGTGQTTRDAGRATPSGSALGVDLSTAMLAQARRRAADEGLDNVRFEQADAQVHPFGPAGHDLLLSRTGTMFFGDIDAAFSNIAQAVRPGGRLAMLTWQGPEHNEWFRELTGALAAGRPLPFPPPGAPGPFALADPSRVRDVLDRAGFDDVALESVTGDMWFGGDAEDAQRFVLGLLGWMIADADEPTRSRALERLRETAASHATADGVVYGSAAWIVTATRR